MQSNVASALTKLKFVRNIQKRDMTWHPTCVITTESITE